MTISDALRSAYLFHRYAAVGHEYPKTGARFNPAKEAIAAARRDSVLGKVRYGKPEAAIYNPESTERGRRGERWIQVPNALLRFAGFADSIASLRHTGWFLSDHGETGETYRGAVWQLPARDGEPVFVPGYVSPHTDSALLDFGNLFRGDDEKTAAARAADSLAERDAETERDYQRAWAAGQYYAESLELAKDCKTDLRQLVAERSNLKRAAKGLTVPMGAVCAAVEAKARELIETRRMALARAAKLLAGDYAESHAFYYWTQDNESAFKDGAGLSQ